MIGRRGGGRADSSDLTSPAVLSGDRPGEGVGVMVLLVVHVLLALLVFEPILFPGADAGHYMVLGEALRNGMGFRDIQLPDSPLHAKFPPGYPLILAVTGWFGGLQLFKAVSLVFTAGSVWLTYRIAGSLVGRRAALIAAGLFAVAPVVLDFSHRVLSEAAFTFILLSVVAATLEDRRVGAVALGAAAAAFFTRTAGLSVLVTLVVWTLLSGEGRRASAAALVALACVVGWVVYQHLAQPSQPGYLQQLIQENPYAPAAGTLSLSDFPARVARNLWRYASSELPGSFGLATARRGTLPLTAIIGVLLSALSLFGWLRSAATRLTVAHLLVAFYVGLILLWPPVWTDRRFLLPVLPLLVVFGAAGAVAISERLGESLGAAAVGLLVTGVAATALLSVGRVVPARVACQASFRSGQPCDSPQYREFYAMAWWVADNTPEGAVIANRSPATFYLFSRRQGDLYAYSRDPSVVIRSLEDMGADYVLVDRLSATTALYLLPAIAANPDRFEVVHVVGGEEGTVLLRVLPVSRIASSPGRS